MSEISDFKSKFLQGAFLEQEISGKYPDVCIMGVDDWDTLYGIAKLECTFTNNLVVDSREITLFNIQCYCSITSKGMSFGSRTRL